MASQEYYSLEGKVKRTVYAIIFNDLVSNVTTIEDAEKKRLMKVVKVAIDDAVEKSVEFLLEHEMIRPIRKRKKSKKAKR